MVYILFLISSITSVISVAFCKLYRKPIKDDNFADTLYYAINVPVAILYFALMCGFNFKVNVITAIFSLAFSLLCYGGVFFQIRALKDTSLVNVSLFSSGGSIIISAIAGVLLFDENILPKSLLGLLFALASIVVPCFTSKNKGTNLKGILFCLLLFVNSGLVRVIMKMYQTTPGCMSENIFCLYTNIFLAPFVVLMHRKNFFDKSTYPKLVKYKKSALIVAASVVLSNVSTLLSMIIVGKVDLFFSSVFGPPLAICTNFLFDTVVFKEKVKKESIISIVFAITSMILMV